MVGLIHKLLFELVKTKASADAVQEVRQRAGIPQGKTFRLDEAYPDDEWRRLFAAACDVLKVTPEEAEQAFGQLFYDYTLRQWPAWFEMSHTAREFLERQPRIHNGFATGVQNTDARWAINDKFQLEVCDSELVIHYRSPNQLCGLYRALARQIIDHFGETAKISETLCLKNGDRECEIHVLWA